MWGWIISIGIAIIIIVIIIKNMNKDDSIVSQANSRVSFLGNCCKKLFGGSRA